MNRYFARLAQRSETAPRRARIGDASSTPTPVAHHSETIASTPLATPSVDALAKDTIASIAPATAVSPPSLSPQILDAHATTVASQPSVMSAQVSEAHAPLAAATTPLSLTTSSPLSTPTANSGAGPVAATSVADANRVPIPAPIVSNTQTASATPARAVPLQAAATRFAAEPLFAAMAPSGDNAAAIYAAIAPTTDAHVAGEAAPAAPMKSHEHPIARAFAAPRAATIAHAPGSAPSSPPRAERAAEVHVHIGKIELAVHAPAPPTKPAPTAPSFVPTVSPAPVRTPRFNAHRHYLRGG